MKFINRTFAFLAFALFLYACRDNFVKCGPEYIAPTDFTAYWRFPTGSYWVYKLDTSIAIYDTVIGTSSLGFWDDNPDGGPCPRRVYQQSFRHSSLRFLNPADTIAKNAVECLYSTDDRLYHTSYVGNLFEYNNLLEYPFKVGDSTYSGNLLSGIETFSSPLGNFDSTIHILHKIAPPPFMHYKHFTEMYMAKRVGIVKIKYSNGETWNLISYEIKK